MWEFGIRKHTRGVQGHDVRSLFCTASVPFAPLAPGGAVVISYAHEDGEVAEALYYALQGLGFDVFLDRMRLAAGQRWREVIDAKIRGASAFVLIWSRAAAVSPFVREEYIAALETELRHPNYQIIPVSLGPVHASPPQELAARNFGVVRAKVSTLRGRVLRASRRRWRAPRAERG